MKLTTSQEKARSAIAASIAAPAIEIIDGQSYHHIRGINGNAVNALLKLGALVCDEHYFSSKGGHLFLNPKLP